MTETRIAETKAILSRVHGCVYWNDGQVRIKLGDKFLDMGFCTREETERVVKTLGDKWRVVFC